MFETLIHKYTGQTVDVAALHQTNPPAGEAIFDAANALANTEQRLGEAADELAATVEKIRANLSAGRGDRVRPLGPLGELQNDHTDVLIAVRAQQIKILRDLVALLTS